MIPGSANFGGMSDAQRNAIVQALLAQQGAPAPALAASFVNPYQDIVDPSDPAVDSTLGDVAQGLPAPSPPTSNMPEMSPPDIVDNSVVNPDAPTPAPPSTIDDQGNPVSLDFGLDVSDPATSPPSGNILGDFGTPDPGFSLGDMLGPGYGVNQGFNTDPGGYTMDPGGFTTDPGNFGPDPGGFTTDPGNFGPDPGGFTTDPGGFGAPGGLGDISGGFDAGINAGFDAGVAAGFDAGVGVSSDSGPGGSGTSGASGGGDGGAGK